MNTSWAKLALIGSLHLAGRTQVAIGREVGVSEGTVRKFLYRSDLISKPVAREKPKRMDDPESWAFRLKGTGSSR